MNKQELSNLLDIKRIVETPAFQENICDVLRKKQNDLKLNFYSDSLKESWKKGGKYDGIEEFFKCLKLIEIRIKDLYDELN